MKKFKWLVSGLIVIFLFGCGSSHGGEDPRKPDDPKGGNQPVRLTIPDHKEPVPPGILEQLSWGGHGGGEGEEVRQKCGSCRVELEGNRLSLSNFGPSQELRVVLYRATDIVREGCGDGVAEFVVMLPVRVDERGQLSVELSGPTKDLIVIFVSDPKTEDRIWMNPLVIYEPLNCPMPE